MPETDNEIIRLLDRMLDHTLLQGRAGTWLEDYERPKVEAEARELLRACGLDTSRGRSARGTFPSTEP
jgi:hypothetical protein